MNKKTILMLINGFGVEKKESYPIYDDTLMPTFAELSKNYLFSNNSVISKVSNIYDAYRNISLDVNELYNYSIVDNDIALKKIINNETLIRIKSDYETKNGNLHLFCLVDTSLKIVNHLKEMLKILNPNLTKKVFLHLIISSGSIEDYKYLIDVFSHINMDLSQYAEIGFIMGLDAISNNAKQVDLNFFFKMFISKVGEKWQSFTQKFDVSYAMKTSPRETKPFIVNSNFSLGQNDTFFFVNYDSIDLTNFINTLSNIKYGDIKNNYTYYSLFAIKSNLNIPYMYETTTSKTSMVKNLESLNATGLIMCKKEEVGVINYYSNGLKNEASNALTFVDITGIESNPNSIMQVINQFNKDLVIINYELNDCKSTVELKEKLSNIDKTLKILEENRNGSKYTLIVSSLYGMTKSMKNDRDIMCTVVFSNELPFMYIDDFLTKKDYLIRSGNINDILKSCYKSINMKSFNESLVEKKNGLYKLFFK